MDAIDLYEIILHVHSKVSFKSRRVGHGQAQPRPLAEAVEPQSLCTQNTHLEALLLLLPSRMLGEAEGKHLATLCLYFFSDLIPSLRTTGRPLNKSSHRKHNPKLSREQLSWGSIDFSALSIFPSHPSYNGSRLCPYTRLRDTIWRASSIPKLLQSASHRLVRHWCDSIFDFKNAKLKSSLNFFFRHSRYTFFFLLPRIRHK